MIPGSCLCGAVRYELDGHLQGLLHCHCGRCRKHHGAPFATFVEVPQSQLRYLAGEQQLVDYPSSPGRLRRFCGVCGSVAPSGAVASGAVASGGVASSRGDAVLVPAGNLLGELGVSGGVHVFVGSRASWHVIADGLPQHEAALPGWTSEVEPPAVPVLPTVPVVAGATQGSCLCGAVSFAVSGAPARWLQCHCSRCRRGRSAAHGSNTFYPLAQFAWRTGRELVRSYKPPEAERFTVSFCSRCGGGAPSERENVPFVLVPAGLFDAAPGSRPQAHIHVSSKAPWYAQQDGLQQFAELPPS